MLDGALNTLGNTSLVLDIGILAILSRLVMAIVLSTLLTVIYRIVRESGDDRRMVVWSLILLATTIAAALMIIGNNLARAFGLVGAVSIIRFRTAIKSSLDMAFVFITIIIGMACGLGFFKLALVFTGVIIAVTIIMYYVNIRQRRSVSRYLLSITLPLDDNVKANFEETIAEFDVRSHMRSYRERGNSMRLRYVVSLTPHSMSSLKIRLRTISNAKSRRIAFTEIRS